MEQLTTTQPNNDNSKDRVTAAALPLVKRRRRVGTWLKVFRRLARVVQRTGHALQQLVQRQSTVEANQAVVNACLVQTTQSLRQQLQEQRERTERQLTLVNEQLQDSLRRQEIERKKLYHVMRRQEELTRTQEELTRTQEKLTRTQELERWKEAWVRWALAVAIVACVAMVVFVMQP